MFEERDTSVLLKSMLRFPIMQLFGSFQGEFFMTAVLIKMCDLTERIKALQKNNPENNLHELQH